MERGRRVGGNAGSFQLSGVNVDLGSHRLHPSTDPEILALLRHLLGSNLLERPRHGRILLKGRWIHFPLRSLDLMRRAHPAFAFEVLVDLARRMWPGARVGWEASAPDDSFASLLERGLGSAVCREFYFPYARKIWGLDPEEISPAQALKRVSARSLGHLLRRLLPGGTGPGGQRKKGSFFYPRGGFGQISEVLAESALQKGAEILLGTRATRILLGADRVDVTVMDEGNSERTLSFHHLWSTIPVGVLVRMIEPPPPPEVLRAADRLEQRAMILVYLVLDQDRFTEFDAHYIPALEVPFTRISEPKNYSGTEEPLGKTVLCAEIPCSPGDPLWERSEGELEDMVRSGLETVELPIRSRVLERAVRRLPSAYPIYRRGFEDHLARLEDWLDTVPRLVSFGRQGLFAHDNTHHALFTAFSAVRCLGDDGRFDEERWTEYRRIFAAHVVED
jgi:protoporphyrinogen oxidase